MRYWIRSYTGGDHLDLIPSHMLEQFFDLEDKCRRLVRVAKSIDPNNRSKDFIFPHGIYDRYLKSCQDIRAYLEQKVPPHGLHAFYMRLRELLDDIRRRDLNIKDSPDLPTRYMAHKRIKYTPFHSKTGRLGVLQGGFPILTFEKKYRHCLLPVNDFFIELDYNAAEARVALALLGKQQPPKDLHSVHAKLLEIESRSEAKRIFFSWFSNISGKVKFDSLERMYERQKILQTFWDGEKCVTTIFGRSIESVSPNMAFNNIMQSTQADIILRRAIAVFQKLRELSLKSHISFLIHDSIILDVKESELGEMKPLFSIFKKTELGNFLANVAIGKSFGSMKKIKAM